MTHEYKLNIFVAAITIWFLICCIGKIKIGWNCFQFLMRRSFELIWYQTEIIVKDINWVCINLDLHDNCKKLNCVLHVHPFGRFLFLWNNVIDQKHNFKIWLCNAIHFARSKIYVMSSLLIRGIIICVLILQFIWHSRQNCLQTNEQTNY